jgi:hypothetical protein
MLMADTMSIFFVIMGMLLAFSGLWLLCRGLWPGAVEAAAERCVKRIWPHRGAPLFANCCSHLKRLCHGPANVRSFVFSYAVRPTRST